MDFFSYNQFNIYSRLEVFIVRRSIYLGHDRNKAEKMFNIDLGKLKKAIEILDFRFLKFKISRCPLHGKSIFVRLNNTMLGVRCVICGAAPIATSMANVLVKIEPDFKEKSIYELSARGAFFEFLDKSAENVVFSEYLDGVQPGDSLNDVLCQDVQQLTFDDGVFDICTSTEVFEHVPDDIKGFREIYRVLRGDGVFIFTVPLHDSEKTVNRVLIEQGEIVYLLEPEYHDDSIRGAGKVLVFRDYGHDLVDRLLSVGFDSVEIVEEFDSAGFGYKKEVIVARKSAG